MGYLFYGFGVLGSEEPHACISLSYSTNLCLQCFLVPAHLGNRGKRALKWVYVCAQTFTMDIVSTANYGLSVTMLSVIVGEVAVMEYEMERIMEQLEMRCYDGLQEAMKMTEGIGIEYDEDVVCDICRSVC